MHNFELMTAAMKESEHNAKQTFLSANKCSDTLIRALVSNSASGLTDQDTTRSVTNLSKEWIGPSYTNERQ